MMTELGQFAARPPPSSPSLIALLELVPPSPILAPSDLSTPITSGEIPILLFEGSCSTTASFEYQQLEERNTSFGPRTWEFNLSRSTLFTADHGSNGVSFDVSAGLSDDRLVNPCDTLDTFGRSIHEDTDSPRRLSLCWSSNTATGDFIRVGEGNQDHSPVFDHHQGTICYEQPWISTSEWDYVRTKAALSEVWGEAGSLEPNASHSIHLNSNEILSQQDSCLDDAQSEDHKLIPVPSSISNLDPNIPKQDSPSFATQGDSCSGEIGSIELCVAEPTSVLDVTTTGSTSSLARRPAIYRTCYSPTFRKEFHIPNVTGDTPLLSRPQIQNIPATTRQGDTISKERGIGSIPGGSPDSYFSVAAHKLPSLSQSPFTPPVPQFCSPHACPGRHTSTPRGVHQDQYAWLQGIVISLAIDQEGFRTIQPVFKRSGLSRHCFPDSGNVEVDVVVFVPLAKQNFQFHYAPWDGLPILRRLIVNGDESRDFLSRQAYLSLKSTGVYTVHGTEIGTLSSVNDHVENKQAYARSPDSTKLYWQFDYSVEDRRAEQTGRILDGEKIFVPLKFTCSPRLLHPNQGKKIKLMQIVKKTVVPKLTAEIKQPNPPNMHHQPPKTRGAIPPVLPATGPMLIPPSLMGNIAYHTTNGSAWNQHRRSQSNAPETSSNSPKTGHTTRQYPTIDGMPIRRRRASSAGESKIKPTRGLSPIRHILPPSRLRQLVEETGGCEEAMESPSTSTEKQLDFFSLKSSPRYRN